MFVAFSPRHYPYYDDSNTVRNRWIFFTVIIRYDDWVRALPKSHFRGNFVDCRIEHSLHKAANVIKQLFDHWQSFWHANSSGKADWKTSCHKRSLELLTEQYIMFVSKHHLIIPNLFLADPVFPAPANCWHWSRTFTVFEWYFPFQRLSVSCNINVQNKLQHVCCMLHNNYNPHLFGLSVQRIFRQCKMEFIWM